MAEFTEKPVKISVRKLIEFILRSGDIDNRHSGMRDTNAMQEGSRIHRKLQKSMKGNYRSEVPLSITLPMNYDNCSFPLTIEGRADGIITTKPGEHAFLPDPMGKSWPQAAYISYGTQTTLNDFLNIKNIQPAEKTFNDPTTEINWKLAAFTEHPKELPYVVIDEIKGVYRHLSPMHRPSPMHRYQALCYAYIYAKEHHLTVIGVQITYCHLINEEVRRFHETVSFKELETWFLRLSKEYGKWMEWQFSWQKQRNRSIKDMPFPFPYRPGQKKFAAGVYSAIYHKKKLYLQAPTGTGKTMSTLYPAVMSLGTQLSEHIFYLTAKTPTRTAAQEATEILSHKGASLKCITITAKEKICPLRTRETFLYHRPPCNPVQCERAAGHFDRINDAVFDLLSVDTAITRDLLETYAARHQVCPFEMALDLSLWCDIIICDYNYLFDPNIYLKRFFSNDKPMPYTFLIDEAHNLVERARDMYSARLYEDEFSPAIRLIHDTQTPLPGQISACDMAFAQLRKHCEDFTVYSDIPEIIKPLGKMFDLLESFLQDHIWFEHRDTLLELYFHVRHFLKIYDLITKKYRIYADTDEHGRFFVAIRCMEPSDNIRDCLMRGNSSILFSATLLPMIYYQEQLAGTKDDYAMLLPSPFPKSNFRIFIAREVNTRYHMRIEEQFQKIAAYILALFDSHQGNYIAFFPSYQMMETVSSYINRIRPEQNLLIQSPSMDESKREHFLASFTECPEHPVLAMCIMGGIFSEGIDLKYDKLIGVVIVGPGLPMVCNERELYRNYFDANHKNGFDYAYLYPGLNKVFQAAGRVIRTEKDRGLILLLDDRFLSNHYYRHFPAEWDAEVVTLDSMREKAREFWGL